MAANDYQVGGTHYKDMGVEPWDVIDTWPIEQQIGYYRGSVLKYTMRMGAKGAPTDDLRKAEHYARKLSEVLTRAHSRFSLVTVGAVPLCANLPMSK